MLRRKISLLVLLFLLCFFYGILKHELESKISPSDASPPQGIAIVVVVAEGSDMTTYNVSLQSIECYARAQGYHFVLAMDSDYDCFKNRDLFFRRHCVASRILSNYSAILFIDADMGIVNPKKRIEEYMDDKIDVTFYDRFWNYEVAAGSYLAKNTPFAMDLIREFGEYEFKLPDRFTGTDNGAIHLFLAEKLFPADDFDVKMCKKAYKNSENWDDIFSYEACIRTIFGASTDFGKVRIMKKGTGWVRDGMLTSGVFNPERDFMLHGWKMPFLVTGPPDTILPKPGPITWFNPFAGPFDLEKCTLANTTWSFIPQLIGDRQAIDEGLHSYEADVARSKISQMVKVFPLLTRRDNKTID